MYVLPIPDIPGDNILAIPAVGALVTGVISGVCPSLLKGIFRNDRRRCTRRKEIADLLDSPFAFEVVRSTANERNPPTGGFGLLAVYRTTKRAHDQIKELANEYPDFADEIVNNWQ